MMIDRDHRARAVAELVRGATILDVGAGTRLLEPLVHGFYVAVDLTLEALPPGDRNVVSGATALPFRDGAFETVACISVLQYVIDVEGALAELRRVAQPGGQIVVLVPNLAYIRHRVTIGKGRLPCISPADSWREGTVRHFTLPDMKPMLERLDLRLSGVACSGRLRSLRRLRTALLGADLILDLERIA